MGEPMTDPDYLAQHGDFGSLDREERMAWWRSRGAEARAGGITHIRMSVDNADNPTMALLEGWIERPADEGEPRWQMVPRTTP